MMDTDLIYRAVCTYGSAKRHGWEYQSGEYLEHVKHLLNEADAERQELLATNERLVDENAELKAKLTEKASLLRGCYAADHKQKQRIEELIAELERIKANPVHQFRKSRCADWFDGYPDPTDGGGPYETRTLYALGSKT